MRLRQLAEQASALRHLTLHEMLKAEGLVVNRKRTYRLYIRRIGHRLPADPQGPRRATLAQSIVRLKKADQLALR